MSDIRAQRSAANPRCRSGLKLFYFIHAVSVTVPHISLNKPFKGRVRLFWLFHLSLVVPKYIENMLAFYLRRNGDWCKAYGVLKSCLLVCMLSFIIGCWDL